MENRAKDSTGRVLVTGGAGFIGANLVRALTESGHDVTVLDNFTSGSRANLEGLSVEITTGDVRDPGLLRDLVPRHHSVVHLAAQSGVPSSLADPRLDMEMNILGTLNVLEACRSAASSGGAGPRVVFASSNAPLGGRTPPYDEESAPKPLSPYGASKLAGEAYCMAYHGSWGLPTVVLRFANVYGPVSAHKSSVVARFMRRAMAGKPLTVYGNGEQTRDFVFVGDLCRAIQAAIEHTEIAGEIFHICTGVETSINALLSGIDTALGGTGIRLEMEGARPGDAMRSYAKFEKAARMLNWKPETSLEQGLRATAAWFRDLR